LDDKREARAEGGRRFQRVGPITEKDHGCPSPRDKEFPPVNEVILGVFRILSKNKTENIAVNFCTAYSLVH